MDKVIETIRLFPDQCEQTISEFKHPEIDSDSVGNITVCAMGASAFGYHVAKSLYQSSIKVPINLHNNYQIPGYINQNSLVIPVSYSGSTEETIKAFDFSLKKKALIYSITQKNSPLGTKSKITQSFFINPTFNPSGQPRMAIGYTVTSLLLLLSSLKLIDSLSLTEIVEEVKNRNNELENNAKKTAENIKNKIILIIAAEHLAGNAHISRNQLNESAKNIAFYNLLPELNHHLLEGFTKPESLRSNIITLVLDSNFYSSRIKQRLILTKEVLQKNNINTIDILLSSKNILEETYLHLAFNSFLSYYLSVLNKVDACEIPWVNYFKQRLTAQNAK